ncbi:MAG: MFS transporter [Acidimicrobiia bacterium]
MPTPAATSMIDRAAAQRRTLATLMTGQVFGGASVSSAVAVAALLASSILNSDRLAGIASAMLTFGAAFASIPLSRMMRRKGRRPGLFTFYVAGMIGAGVAAIGGQLRSMLLFIPGMFLFGFGQASNLQGRYVGADLAEPDRRARAIATVVWVGTLGAVFGPVLSDPEKRLGEQLGLDRLVGPFLFSSLFFGLAALNIYIRLRPDPLVLAGGLDDSATPAKPVFAQLRHSIGVIGRYPRAKLALVAMIISQASMVAVMTMTPLHMKDHGHADLSAFVVAVHIVGMYGFAPLIGRFADRQGRIRTLVAAGAILAAGTVVAVLAGYHPTLIFLGLFLLGVGWNFGLIGGSALLTESVPAVERVATQGSADLLMSLCGGTAGFSSGFIKTAWGYHWLANGATVAAGVLLALAFYAQRLGTSATPSAAA